MGGDRGIAVLQVQRGSSTHFQWCIRQCDTPRWRAGFYRFKWGVAARDPQLQAERGSAAQRSGGQGFPAGWDQRPDQYSAVLAAGHPDLRQSAELAGREELEL